MIYLASPYSDPNSDIREERYKAALWCVASLISTGAKAFSPIVHNYYVAKLVGDHNDWFFWRDYDLCWLRKCESMFVLNILGWEKSVGVTAERVFASSNNIPVSLVNVEGGFISELRT